MNRTDRDVTRIVESWLEDGVTQLPDRVLDEVERQLPATHQRRAGWLARRFPVMNNTTLRYGIAAAVVVIAALVGIRFLPSDVGGPGPTSTPTAEPTPISTPAPLGSRESMAPGDYAVPGFRAEITVAVPSGGWSSNGNWVLAAPATDPDNGITIRFYTIPNLAVDPLSHAAGNLDPPVGPTVDDLVEAIVAHPGWIASEPTDITIDGRDGQLVTITIPVDGALPADGDGQFYFYAGPAEGGIYGWLPGQTFDWYIVDVDGERLIIDAFHYPDASAADLAAQRAVVESVQFGS